MCYCLCVCVCASFHQGSRGSFPSAGLSEMSCVCVCMCLDYTLESDCLWRYVSEQLVTVTLKCSPSSPPPFPPSHSLSLSLSLSLPSPPLLSPCLCLHPFFYSCFLSFTFPHVPPRLLILARFLSVTRLWLSSGPGLALIWHRYGSPLGTKTLSVLSMMQLFARCSSGLWGQ